MIILGLNAYHGDSAACLLRDGKLEAAAEEERFRRVKHYAGFPSQAVAYCLAQGGITLSDVDYVAINRNNRANFMRKLSFVAQTLPSPLAIVDRLRNRAKWAGVEETLAQTFPKETLKHPVEHIEHHLAHLASAFYASPFEGAVALSVDGIGDFASAAWGVGDGNKLSLDGRVLFPHSLGIFYQAMTQYLGFPNYGDEYKLMGLAAYGKASCVAEVRPLVELQQDGSYRLNLKYFRHHRENIANEWQGGPPAIGDLFSRELETLLGPRRDPSTPLTDRHRDLAYATQAVYEEAFFHLLNALYRRYSVDAVALAGGCAYNSVANGKIRDRSPFKRVYLQSAAGDAGGAIGAAYVVWHRENGRRSEAMKHAYWGPGASDDHVSRLLSERSHELAGQDCGVIRQNDEASLVDTVARAIADGQVIGWFQGRMEWGPRALGNRSILGDPRRANMKDILNLKIKRRESFRPFAPSVLREEVEGWFERNDDVPFMMQVFPIKPERRATIPAVTHVDGTGRLQTVDRETNPRYHKLISAFRLLTGVPMVLNTSFNENEPVVCKPEEALDCFLRTKMDMLVINDFIITRQQQAVETSNAAAERG